MDKRSSEAAYLLVGVGMRDAGGRGIEPLTLIILDKMKTKYKNFLSSRSGPSAYAFKPWIIIRTGRIIAIFVVQTSNYSNMSKFIILHKSQCKQTIYLNSDYIVRFEWTGNQTMVYMTQNDTSLYGVSETPEEIMEMLAD